MEHVTRSPLAVTRWGSGPPVLLIHGSIVGGISTWSAQRPLAERWKLLIPDRRGYGQSPPSDGEDFLVDTTDLAALVEPGTHIAGHSYGGVVALLVAGQRQDAVRSLTIVEAPAFRLVEHLPEARDLMAAHAALRARPPEDPELFLRQFLALVGGGLPPSARPTEEMLRGVQLLRKQRVPWDADIPLAALYAAPFPKLVMSGAHSAVMEATCDALASGIGAERRIMKGRGHIVQRLGAPFNDLVEDFWRRAEAAGPAHSG